MPVVQISRIQHRRGLSIDLPNPSLAEGEIGMTIDTGELFVGAPNFPPIINRTTYPYQNLRILTEFSVRDILSNLQYVYRDQQRYNFANPSQLNPDFPGYKSYAANPGWTVERLLQERLDEVVSVKSYGAHGNAYNDDYLPIEHACLDLYTNQYKNKQPKILYFPAGVYIINTENALPIFEGTYWVGDGSGRTIIYLMNNTARAVIETADWYDNQVHRNNQIGVFTEKPVQNIFISGMTLARSSVGDIMRLDRANTGLFLDVEFVVADLNNGILTKNNTWDTSSSIGGITSGGWPTSTKYSESAHGICVRIDRMSSLIPEIDNWYSGDFNFIDCQFKSNTYGFYMVDSIDNVTITESLFDDLFKGVSLGEAIYYSLSELDNIGDFAWSLPFNKDLGQTYLNWDPTGLTTPGEPGPWGPSGIKVTNSVFRNIFDVPFSVFSNKPGNISANNTYIRYGGVTSANGPLPITRIPDNEAIFFYKEPLNSSPISAPGVINVYLAEYNTSVGDTFDYVGQDNLLRVKSPSVRNLICNSQTPLLSPAGAVLGIQTFLPMKPENEELLPGETNTATNIKFNVSKLNSIIIDYSILRNNSKKKGELHIIADGSNIDWYETILEIGATPVDFSFNIAFDGGDVVVYYTDDAISNPNIGYLHWSARAWNHSYNNYGSF